MEFKTFVDYAVGYWLDCLKADKPMRTLCLLGPPGIGKSATAREIARRMTEMVRKDPKVVYGNDAAPAQSDINAVCELLDFTSKLPEDLGGLPFRTGQFTEYCPQRWVDTLCQPHSFGVYCEDDITQAAKAMQVAGRQSALERRIHNHRFAPGVLVMVTGNRREDKAAASTLPSHFINSITILSIEPSLSDWVKWYGKQKGHAPIVAAFLRWKPELLSQTPDKKDKAGRFATPRQWASLGSQFDVATAHKLLNEIATGAVGEGPASTFAAFVEIRSQLVDPELVFDDPQGALPNPKRMLDDPSKVVAMVTALGEIGASRSKKGKGKTKTEAPEKLMFALAHATTQHMEHCATGVYTFLDNGGNLTDMARVARARRDDPVLGKLLDHLKVSLLGGKK